MRSPVPLRRRSVVWLLLPAVPLLLIVAQLSPPVSPPPQWWTWTVGRSVLLLLVPAAVGATGAALEASRLRARRAESALDVRAPASVVAVALWPSLACAFAMQALAVAIVALTGGGTSGTLPWGMIGAISAMLFFHTCLGFALGSVLRPVLGIPVALAASYAWLGFTGTLPTFELRHLAGLVIETCCAYDQQPIAASLIAATVFSVLAGIGLLVLACAAVRLDRGHALAVWVAGAALPAVAFAVGLAVATGLPPSAAEPRDARELICSLGEVAVCVFPEQADPAMVDSVAAMLSRARAEGVDLPAAAVASDSGAHDPERVRFTYRPGMTVDQVAGSLASDMPETVCEADAVATAIRRDTARSAAVPWLHAAMRGRDPSQIDGEDLDPAVATTLSTVVARPREEQVAWVNGVLASLRDCAIDPPAGP